MMTAKPRVLGFLLLTDMHVSLGSLLIKSRSAPAVYKCDTYINERVEMGWGRD